MMGERRTAWGLWLLMLGALLLAMVVIVFKSHATTLPKTSSGTFGNVIVREVFARPVGTFDVEVTYGRLASSNFSRTQAMTERLVCGDRASKHPDQSTSGLVVAFECSSGVTIRVGSDARTFFCDTVEP